MKTYFIKPIDSLLFGDGKPFSCVPGSTATSLVIPHSIPIAGAVRTRLGLDKSGRFDSSRIAELKEVTVNGPIFAQIRPDEKFVDWVFPIPSDAVPIGDINKFYWKRLRPLTVPEGAKYCSFGLKSLVPAGFESHIPQKPIKGKSLLWSWEKNLKPWLINDSDIIGSDSEIRTPEADRRIHIGLSDQEVTIEGALFSTESRNWVFKDYFLSLSVMVGADVPEGLGPLGGEMRQVRWEATDLIWPDVPKEVVESAKKGKVRMVLATAACFNDGSKPETFLKDAPKGTELISQISGNYQGISGWDYETKKPKPTKRLVPAGSVFFLKLGGTEQERELWLRNTWLNTVSDTEEDRKSGLGLALFGVWNSEFSMKG